MCNSAGKHTHRHTVITRDITWARWPLRFVENGFTYVKCGGVVARGGESNEMKLLTAHTANCRQWVCTWIGWRRWYLLSALSCQYRVVLFPIIIGVKKLLKPLEKLKVVLKFPLHQFLHRDDLRVKASMIIGTVTPVCTVDLKHY